MRHQDRIFGFGDGGVHEHAGAAEFHGDGSVRGGADSGVDENGNFGLLDDEFDVEAILDSETGTDWSRKGHDGAAADIF